MLIHPTGRAPARPRPHRHGRRVHRAAERSRRPANSPARIGSACCSTAKRPAARTSGSPADCARPGCASPPSSRTSTSARHRGLDRALFLKLASCQWIRDHHHLVIGGPTGIGKSWLACALGHKACREGFSVLYRRAPRLFTDLAQARGEGRAAAADDHARTHAPADHRRLGAGTAQRRSAARSARDRRRPLRQGLAADHQSGPGQSLA